jgi:hypothetical protein
MLRVGRMMRKEQTHFPGQLRSFYVKPGATGLISHGRDEKISKFGKKEKHRRKEATRITRR